MTTGSKPMPCGVLPLATVRSYIQDVYTIDRGDVLVWAGGRLFDVTRSGTCSDFRWRVVFRSTASTQAATLPLLSVRFSDGTVGFNRFINATRLEASTETVAPLPGAMLRVPVSLGHALCSSFNVVPEVHDRAYSFPLVVFVNSRAAGCSSPLSVDHLAAAEASLLCQIQTRPDMSPVILSVIPNVGALKAAATAINRLLRWHCSVVHIPTAPCPNDRSCVGHWETCQPSVCVHL